MADHITSIEERIWYMETGPSKELHGVRQLRYLPSPAVRSGFGLTCPRGNVPRIELPDLVHIWRQFDPE
jgi:hypothetical protein